MNKKNILVVRNILLLQIRSLKIFCVCGSICIYMWTCACLDPKREYPPLNTLYLPFWGRVFSWSKIHSFLARLEATKLQQFSFLCPIHRLSYRHSQNTLLVCYIQTPVFMIVQQTFITTELSVPLQIRSSLPYFLDFFLKCGIAYIILFTW